MITFDLPGVVLTQLPSGAHSMLRGSMAQGGRTTVNWALSAEWSMGGGFASDGSKNEKLQNTGHDPVSNWVGSFKPMLGCLPVSCCAVNVRIAMLPPRKHCSFIRGKNTLVKGDMHILWAREF